MNSTTKLGCALAWLTIGGANVASAAPAKAAPRCRTTRLTISQYQAVAVAASPSVITSASDTAGPSHSVSGANGTLSPSMTVLAMRFTPSGKPWRVVNSGLRR